MLPKGQVVTDCDRFTIVKLSHVVFYTNTYEMNLTYLWLTFTKQAIDSL